MLKTTLGALLVNRALPPEMRDHDRVLTKKATAELFDQLARDHPEQYREVAKKLTDVARTVAYRTGGFSFEPGHMRTPPEAALLRKQLELELQQVQRQPGDPAAKDAKIVALLQRYQKPLEDLTFQAAQAAKNPFAHQVANVGRGDRRALKGLLAGDLLYQDAQGNNIAVPILHSYAQGLRPYEYWAAGFGARSGVVDTKLATQRAGFYCLHEDTRVRLADGTCKALKLIQPGEMVIAWDRIANRPLPTRVVANHDNGLRECLRYRAFSSRRGWFNALQPDFGDLIATPEHQVLALGRLPAYNIGPGLFTLSTFALCQAAPYLIAPSFTAPESLERMARGELPIQLADDLLGRSGYVTCVVREADDRPFESVGPQPTRDLEVEHPDHLYILEDGWIVSNSKQLTQATHRLVVTAKDAPEPEPEDLTDGHCLAAGTRVQMADGSTKAIEDIAVDDMVLAYARDRDCSLLGSWLTTNVRPDRIVASRVRRVFKRGRRACLRLRGWADPDHEIELVATPDHRVLTMTVAMPGELATLGMMQIRSLVALPSREAYIQERKRAARPDAIAQDLRAGLSSELRLGWHQILTLRPSSVRTLLAATETLWDNNVIWNPPEDAGVQPTHDIEIEHPDHLFVLANMMVVANSTVPSGPRGLPVATGDPHNEGALLAAPIAGFDRNTVLTPRILKEIHRQGHERLLVRSPLVGGPDNGGVYARDVGVREKGALPPRGDFVGLAAAQSVGEKLSQNMLNAKHKGGVAGEAEDIPAGFPQLSAIIQALEDFPGAATHAEKDGRVAAITDAPQGGRYVTISGVQHYVAPDRTVTVHPGDEVEAGDMLSNGVPSPALLVKHKGIGEGSRQFVEGFRRLFAAANMTSHRRNVELLGRGLIDHVRLKAEIGENLPEDLISYHKLEHDWVPRPGTEVKTLGSAMGKYLEKPVLHYTIGTQIKPSVRRDLEHFGITEIAVHPDPPPFEPEVVRAMANLQHDPDFMTRFLGSNLSKGLLDSAHRGRSSDTAGTSFVPALAERLHFGQRGLTQGWKPQDIEPIDRDRDGTVFDGTPQERPAQRQP